MNAIRNASSRVFGRVRGVSPLLLGLVTALLVVAMIPLVFNLDRITTLFSSGQEVDAEFSKNTKLVPYDSNVKLAGVVVGTVTGTEPAGNGHSVVSMEVNDDIPEKLGSAPSAKIRVTLALGGKYYVDLVPGGSGTFDGKTIPVDRTTLPVELGNVLSAIDPSAQKGIQASIGQTDATLRQGGRTAAKRLLSEAPRTLRPAGKLLEAARGMHPDTDLTKLVSGARSTADALTRRDGQLESIVDSLQHTTEALSAERAPLADATAEGPENLRATRAGMADLHGTLDKLTTTARSFRPAARELEPLLSQLDPTLAHARPLSADLRPLLEDARPLVEQLVPTSEKATGALDDVRGPVLDRINGPITKTVMSPWKGTGPYEGGGATGARFYEETGYLLSDAADIYKYYDHAGNHGVARLATGAGANSIGGAGVPQSFEQYLEELGLDPQGPEADSGDGRLPDLPGILPRPGKPGGHK
jgi:phospholipid/cholesterol/gamma-HCH transport system substrate-binding protein